MKKLFAACIILAASALVFTSCGSKSDDSDEDEESSSRSGKKERVEKREKDEDDFRGSKKKTDWIHGEDEMASSAKEEKALSEKLSVGFSQVGAESDWRRASTKSIEDAVAQRPQIELTFSDAMQKQENQIKAIRSFIRKKVDVIAFSPVVSSGFEGILKEAGEAGIPVVLVDRAVDADPSLYVSLVGSDFTEEGRRAARWLIANKPAQDSIKVIELSGTPGSAPAIERQKGFAEIIESTPEIKVVFSQSGNFTRVEGKRVMEAILQTPEGKDFDVLFAHNDDMALGAIEAIRDVGKVPGKDIIISVDGIKDILKAIRDGNANCTVECNPLIGPQLFDVIEKVAKGETVPARIPSIEGVFDNVGGFEVGDGYESVKTTKVTQDIIDGRKY